MSSHPQALTGLSFELAPPRPAHALRSDIALFVGTLARRRRVASDAPQALPVPLSRWLAGQGIARVGGLPLARLRLSLASAGAFAADLLAQAADLAERARLSTLLDQWLNTPSRRASFTALLDACRELSPLPESLVEELRLRGLTPDTGLGGMQGGDGLEGWLRLQTLLNLPVAVESFEQIDALFAWEQRGVRERVLRAGDPVVPTPTGVALRAFFGEGGRRAYIVRSGDPSCLFESAGERFNSCFPEPGTPERCAQLPGVQAIVRRGFLSGLRPGGRPVALSAADWVGLEHVYGLNDVAFALLPDLVDACAQSLGGEPAPPEVIAAPEHFRECAVEAASPSTPAGRRLPAPRLNSLGLAVWRRLLLRALNLLDNPGRPFHRRDVQLLASLPLLGEGRELPAPDQWLLWMARQPGWMQPAEDGEGELLGDRLQLAYPWLRTDASADAQGGVEAPEGSLAGLLARSALERGSYRSAARQRIYRYQDSEPPLAWTQALQHRQWTPLGELSLAQRVCLLGPSPRGPQLLSDVSCAADPRTRQAAVRRLINVVIQAARQAGEELVFEANGEALWARVRERLSDLMRALLSAGALSGDGQAFAVRCGRDTMRQSDIDAGRLLAEIEIQPAQPIQRIVVVLNLRDAGPARLLAEAA
ncbi:hypothetical protein PEC18_32900 [Paucibacter sp. O1-1]|nr:hypothetical protein [Paucibacter sp. O1-1]MDA3830501.1 hypothetical protein [Paucibacter sp. O1-1]